ncbi:hypothetical protein [Clostridium beijerinckii]|nr:hypothetical protein [Clostridium beijerinckii]AQS04781.1 hypothetical protein CLBIJ_22110 [Clostridium beijerinckii]MBA2887542.1 hypothetical protein [Clostridium beijerinckii]MBC2418427.1 hypothetical protein [Clostridium beijerinckii]MBC2423855.1 hypothetical protein [Clostridium beijerinckii]MBC2433398.1 hypothetical protein [Clostridium beijerinckii]
MLIKEDIERIKEKTIPSLCEFIERVCGTTTSEKELEVLPEVVESLSLLIQAIQ